MPPSRRTLLSWAPSVCRNSIRRLLISVPKRVCSEFEKFWESHRGVPLKKIQLRYIRADGLPNSAFCDQDCVSADMFMFRRHRHPFERYLEQTFAPGAVRANPGKHSC